MDGPTSPAGDLSDGAQPTVKDVAELAGVSLGTVSRFLNGQQLKTQNHERVAEAIRRLNFRRNVAAGGLRSGRSLAIGVLVDDFTSLFVSAVVSAIEERLETSGYGVVLSDYHANASRLKEKVLFLQDRNVDGIILFPHAHQEIEEAEQLLISSRIPVCLVNDPRFHTPWDTVLTNNYEATYKAVEYLISMGHRSIAGIVGNMEYETARLRLQGAQDALRDSGVSFVEDAWPVGNYSTPEAYVHAERLLQRDPLPTAVFGMSYNMTLGLLMAIYDKQLRIPQDISVISFDDIDLFRAMNPRITTLRQPIGDIGKAAADLLGIRLKRRNGDPPIPPTTRVLDSDLIVRDSVSRVG